MKINYFVLLCFVFMVASCQKETDLFAEQKAQIVGTWNVTAINFQEVVEPGLTTISKDTFKFQAAFTDDEKITFIYAPPLGFQESHRWYYQLAPEKVIIAYDDGPGAFFRPTKYFEVRLNDKNKQDWHYSNTTITPTSTTLREETWLLSK